MAKYIEKQAFRLTNRMGLLYNTLCYHRGVEQLVARRAHNPEVAGSNPVPATN